MSNLRILSYHRIIDPARVQPGFRSRVSATVSAFEQQMLHIAARYRVVSLPEVLEAQRGGSPLPARAVLLTFDDAYRDFMDVAWPVLRARGIPAAVCVPTLFADDPRRTFWWDRLHHAFTHTSRKAAELGPALTIGMAEPHERRSGLKRAEQYILSLPNAEAEATVDRLCGELGVTSFPDSDVLGWEELRALAAQGVSLVAHTRTHAALTKTDTERVEAEVRDSIAGIQRATGSALPVFCYPYGLHDDRVVEAVAKHGVELAFTSLDGHNALPSANPLRLRRTVITPRTTPFVFGLRLLKAVSYVDMWRHRPKQTRETSSGVLP